MGTKTKTMKTNILKYSILTAILGIALWSCKKDEPSNQVINFTESQKMITMSPEQFGQLHNQYLAEAINHFNTGKFHKEAFMALDFPQLTKAQQSTIYDQHTNLSMEQMKNYTFQNFNSESSKNYYARVELAVDNHDDYNLLVSELNEIKNEIALNSQNNDKNLLFIYIETIKSSAYFWTPTELGGSGQGVLYAARPYCSHCSGGGNKPDTDSWIKADGRGAGYGMSFWAVSGLFLGGPVGGVAGFLYGAVSGAISNSFLP